MRVYKRIGLAERLSESGALTGRGPSIRPCAIVSKGGVVNGQAKRELRKTLDVLRPQIDAGVPVIGLEPACVAVFRDDQAQRERARCERGP